MILFLLFGIIFSVNVFIFQQRDGYDDDAD